MELEAEMVYHMETFRSNLKAPTKLRELPKPAGLQLRETLTMENVFNEFCNGEFLGAVWKIILVDEDVN